jgi:hypothetical protein
MKRILTLALVATMCGCSSGGTGGTGGDGGRLPDGGAGGGSAAGGGSGGGTAAGGGAGGGTAAGGGAGGGTAAGGGAGGGTAAGGGAGGGTAAGGGAGGGAAGGGAGGGAAGGGAGGGTGTTCALDMPAQCATNTFCYPTTGSGTSGTCFGGCDIVGQNCTAANTQCNYGPDAGRDCFPDGTLPEGSACGTGVAMGCIKGTTCVGIPTADAGSPTSCAKFCRTSNDCIGGKICSIQLQIPGTNERPLVCNTAPPGCSLLQQNCAVTTNGCYPASANTAACFPAGNVATGGACATGNACMKGAICLGGANGCRPLCNTDAGMPTCATGACNPLTFGSDGGGEQGVGACL